MEHMEDAIKYIDKLPKVSGSIALACHYIITAARNPVVFCPHEC